MSTCLSSIKWSAFLSGCPQFYLEPGHRVSLSHLVMTPGFASSQVTQPLLSGWVCVTWPSSLPEHRGGDSVRKHVGEAWDQICRAASVCGKKCLNTQSVACQNTDSIVCTDVCLPATPTPQTHTPPTRGQGTSSSEGARRHLSSWYLGTGLGVVCPVLMSFLCFSAEGHGQDSWPYLFAVSGIARGPEGGRPHVVYYDSQSGHRTRSLAVLRLWLEAPRPGVSGGATVQGSNHMVQEDACVASTQMVVDLVDLEGWCPAALQGLRVTYIWPFKLLFTHISHKWVGRSSVIWERTLGHLLCLPYRASATWTHTQAHAHTCIYIYMYIHPHMRTHIPHIYTHTCACTHTNICTHMHMPPHAHIPAHTETVGCAQSGLRGWEPLVSQCVNCFSFLLGFLSRSQMSV